MSNITRKLNRNKKQTTTKEVKHRKVLERIQIEKIYGIPLTGNQRRILMP